MIVPLAAAFWFCIGENWFGLWYGELVLVIWKGFSLNALVLMAVFVAGVELRGGGGGETLRNDFLLQHARQILIYEETITAMKRKPMMRERE
jgi:hypothetical protein